MQNQTSLDGNQLQLGPVSIDQVSNFFLSDPNLTLLGIDDEEIDQLYSSDQFPVMETDNMDGIYINGELVAINRWQWFTPVAINMHFYLKSKYQGTGKLDKIFEFVKEKLIEHDTIEKVLIFSPETCIHVQKVMDRYGFVKEGVLTKCHNWKGKLVDLHVYAYNLHGDK